MNGEFIKLCKAGLRVRVWAIDEDGTEDDVTKGGTRDAKEAERCYAVVAQSSQKVKVTAELGVAPAGSGRVPVAVVLGRGDDEHMPEVTAWLEARGLEGGGSWATDQEWIGEGFRVWIVWAWEKDVTGVGAAIVEPVPGSKLSVIVRGQVDAPPTRGVAMRAKTAAALCSEASTMLLRSSLQSEAPVVTPVAGSFWTPRPLELDAKGEPAKGSMNNAAEFVRRAIEGHTLARNILSGVTLFDGRPFGDGDLTAIRASVSARWRYRVEKGDVQDIIDTMANERSFSPVENYLRSLVWDGTPRLTRVATEVLHLEGHRAPVYGEMLRSWFVSAAQRGLFNGIRADRVLVLQGGQGVFKSTFFQVLAHGLAAGSLGRSGYAAPTAGGEDSWYLELGSEFDPSDEMAPQRLRGGWIVEFSEIDAMSRHDAAVMKAFISRASDRYRRKYARNDETFPRRVIFGGSTNRRQPLRDETGGRRYLIVGYIEEKIDTRLLGEWREQLWAEATHLALTDASAAEFSDEAAALAAIAAEGATEVLHEDVADATAIAIYHLAWRDFREFTGTRREWRETIEECGFRFTSHAFTSAFMKASGGEDHNRHRMTQATIQRAISEHRKVFGVERVSHRVGRDKGLRFEAGMPKGLIVKILRIPFTGLVRATLDGRLVFPGLDESGRWMADDDDRWISNGPSMGPGPSREFDA